MTPARAKISELLDRYDGFLVDAYGVLNDSAGPLPGAAALIEALERRGRPWLVLTNDSSRLPSTIAARLARFGLPVPVERILSSGMLIAPWFAANGLRGRPTTVLGTDDSRTLIADAGGVIVEPGEAAEIVVVADDSGYPFLEAIEATINACARALDAGAPLTLLLPNPDLVYPRRDGVGLTSGAVAALIELALARLHRGAPRFVGLGKPHAPIYDEAKRRVLAAAGLGTSSAKRETRGISQEPPAAASAAANNVRVLAIGDSLETDIAGALAAGIDAAFVPSATGRWRPGDAPVPTFLLDSIGVGSSS